MKRFGEYISNQDEKVAPSIEKTVEKKSIDEAASLGDLLIGLAAAGGAAGFKAAWNKWAPTKGARAKRKEKADDKEERRQEKIAKAKKKGNEKKLKKLMSPDEYKKYGDEKTQKKKDDQKAKLDKKGEKERGGIEDPKDAEAYFKKHGEAPRGWRNAAADGEAPELMTRADYAKELKRRRKINKKQEPDKKPEPTDNTNDSFKPEGDMALKESPELQAIMSLDDEGIKADINRKGQVVVKKKDLKKAEKKLKKEFGGKFKSLLPKLVGEEVLEDGTDAMINQYKKDTPGQRTAWEVVSKARAKIIEAVDAEAARELYLFMQNERSLMRQKDSIIKNISNKMKSGKYDHKQAPKLWMYWVDNGAKEYDKLYSSPGVKTFDKDTKMSVAIQLGDEYKAEIELGNYS